MTRKILLLFFLLSFSSNYSQDSIAYFSDALRLNINSYNAASNRAFENKDFNEGKRLFDSLVQYKLIGTRFDDFTVKGYNSKDVILNNINKPILLVTYASWCILNKGDAPALNELAKKYPDDLQIVIIFWDKKQNLKKIANQFSNAIKICYANESYANDFRIIATLKHTLGIPTVFFIDENKKVVNINRVKNHYKPKISFDTALTISYDLFDQMINPPLNKITTNSGIANNNN
ncbi:thiol-disulfide isomerase/thioredoxin [Flavobacterium limicola]|uniref:Thiol-disulfide isomerase/thioredoxin n=1 Tax=Flavobacterium limicola TaxID=180441 RepID=A0A495RSU8_9FLAO|nr:thioredoxin family protein [Flavobacterium limicola]RKS90380.1 thiol-disulfide isomerase/thioredoxin [Flavobacterium limicola]